MYHTLYIYIYHTSEPDIVCHVSHHDLPIDSSVSVLDVFAIRSLMVWCIDPFGSASWRKHEKIMTGQAQQDSKCSAVDLCAWYVYMYIYIKYICDSIYAPAYYFLKYFFKNYSSFKDSPSQIEENEVSEMQNKSPFDTVLASLQRGCQCPAWRTLHSGEFQCQW